jgi:signal transduction histidine kinase/CheY-like chemotaxis protein
MLSDAGLAALVKIASDLNGARTPSQVAGIFLKSIVPPLGAYGGGVVLIAEDNPQSLEALVIEGFAPSVNERFHRFPVDSPFPTRIAIREKQPVFVGDLAEWNARFRPVPGTRTISSAALPLIVEGDAIGAMTLSFDTPRTFAASEREYLVTVASLLAQALGRTRAYAREEQARRVAEEALHARDQFVATLSHELRTPLNAALGWVDIIQRRGVPPELRHPFQVIERNVRAQAVIVEEVLELNRTLTGELHLSTGPLSLDAVLAAAIDAVRPAAEAKDLGLVLNAEVPGLTVDGDAARLQQVFGNLLSNSVKFTSTGGVTIELDAIGTQARVRITDTGAGIPPEALPFIFDPFWQRTPQPGRLGGLGIGLSVVRSVVEAHGGAVSAHSEGDGDGATFTVLLPLSNQNLSTSNEPKDSIAGVLDGLSILYVEDSLDTKDAVTEMLLEAGARVVGAASLNDALVAIEHSPFDAVVCDIGLPDGDGYQVIRAIRDRERVGGAARRPAVALTALTSTVDRKRALLQGFDIHLPKPTDAADLIRSLAVLRSRPAAVNPVTNLQ